MEILTQYFMEIKIAILVLLILFLLKINISYKAKFIFSALIALLAFYIEISGLTLDTLIKSKQQQKSSDMPTEIINSFFNNHFNGKKDAP